MKRRVTLAIVGFGLLATLGILFVSRFSQRPSGTSATAFGADTGRSSARRRHRSWWTTERAIRLRPAIGSRQRRSSMWGFSPRGSGPGQLPRKSGTRFAASGGTEGSIGTLKSNRYQFDKPRERLWHTLEMAGPGSIFSFNLNKFMRDFVELTR